MYRLQSLTPPFLDSSTSCRADRRSDPTPNDTRTNAQSASDVHEKGVGCVARGDIEPPYGKASSATPVSGARKRAPRRVLRSRSKAQAASRLRAMTGEETNSSRSYGARVGHRFESPQLHQLLSKFVLYFSNIKHDMYLVPQLMP
jgi:hypothetical protein